MKRVLKSPARAEAEAAVDSVAAVGAVPAESAIAGSKETSQISRDGGLPSFDGSPRCFCRTG